MKKLIVIALIGAVAFVILKKKGFIGANYLRCEHAKPGPHPPHRWGRMQARPFTVCAPLWATR